MSRRGFIAGLGAAALMPLAGRAQQPERMRRIGVLIGSPSPESHPYTQAIVAAFGQALRQLGWVEGKNLRSDYRFAAGDPALFKAYAAELVALAPDAILASTPPAVVALQQQTRTIPIVFALVGDPVGQGFVQSIARPGGNITGFSVADAPIMGKWLQLLKEIAPGITQVTVIFGRETGPYPLLNRAIEAAGPSLAITATLAPVHDDAGIEEAIGALAREPGGGLIILPDSFNATHSAVIVAAAIRYKLPSIGFTELVRTGCLISYWSDAIELHAQAASYIDRILKGANPAELPIQYPTKYSLIINLNTAKALGLTVPPNLLDLADEVIE